MAANLASPICPGISRRLLGASEPTWPSSLSFSPSRSPSVGFRSPRNPSGLEIVRASASGKRPQLIIPSSSSNASSGTDLYLPFRPPVVDKEPTEMSVEEKLSILSDRRGLWHEYAPVLTSLQRAGFTATVIDETCGINGVEQNTIVVATQVYKSLQASGLGAVDLSYFDAGGAEVLYEFRTLSTQQRMNAARYAIDERLDAKGARELTKAMKEHERRKREEGQASFSTAPGDCLAFALYRQSKEYRSEPEKQAVLCKALEKAVTKDARLRLEYALGRREGEEAAPPPPPVAPLLQMVRLVEDESVARPIPVLGKLEELDAATVEASAVVSSLEGPFRMFTPSSGCQWLSLPGWNALVDAQEPVGILVSNVSSIPSVEVSSTEPALLVIDRAVRTVSVENHYLVASSNAAKGLTIAAGSDVGAKNLKSLGRVLLTLLPPAPVVDEEAEPWQ